MTTDHPDKVLGIQSRGVKAPSPPPSEGQGPGGSGLEPPPRVKLIGYPTLVRDEELKLTALADTDNHILIFGETGVGKEIRAAFIQQQSHRQAQPFVKINCAGFSRELMQSELFGHQKGAFTGALKQHIGLMQTAHRGTIFLDEFGAMDQDVQAKLLRFLENQAVYPLGGNQPLTVDVRIIAATNEPTGIRKDIQYRFPHHYEVPPPNTFFDLPYLIQYFLQEEKINGISAFYLLQLLYHNYPGHIRELRHLIKEHKVMHQHFRNAAQLQPPIYSSSFLHSLFGQKNFPEEDILDLAFFEPDKFAFFDDFIKELGITNATYKKIRATIIPLTSGQPDDLFEYTKKLRGLGVLSRELIDRFNKIYRSERPEEFSGPPEVPQPKKSGVNWYNLLPDNLSEDELQHHYYAKLYGQWKNKELTKEEIKGITGRGRTHIEAKFKAVKAWQENLLKSQ